MHDELRARGRSPARELAVDLGNVDQRSAGQRAGLRDLHDLAVRRVDLALDDQHVAVRDLDGLMLTLTKSLLPATSSGDGCGDTSRGATAGSGTDCAASERAVGGFGLTVAGAGWATVPVGFAAGLFGSLRTTQR